MDLSVYFQPVSNRIAGDAFEPNMLGSTIDIYREGREFPELEGVAVALIGVNESRGHEANNGCEHAPDAIRRYFYRLYRFDREVKVVDLGNIQAGAFLNDTFYAVSDSCQQLIKQGIVPVVIGGSQDLTYAMYQGYEKLEDTINVATIDPRLDLSTDAEAPSSATNYLNRLILHQPNYLFNYSNLSGQRYLTDPDMLEMMDRMYFDTTRLGQLAENIQTGEPALRNADLVSIDISAVRQTDAPGTAGRGPNGLRAEHLCQLAWYAGMGDKLTSLGLFEVNPELDENGQTVHLAAQTVWCFLDGFSQRKEDYPKSSLETCTKYTVHLESSGHDLLFYKSEKTDRWWMDVPYPAGITNRYQRHHIVPCTYEEYLQAARDEVPDRYWRTFQKLV